MEGGDEHNRLPPRNRRREAMSTTTDPPPLNPQLPVYPLLACVSNSRAFPVGVEMVLPARVDPADGNDVGGVMALTSISLSAGAVVARAYAPVVGLLADEYPVRLLLGMVVGGDAKRPNGLVHVAAASLLPA